MTNHLSSQVSQIKEKVEEKEGIPPVQQRLIFSGKQMSVKTFNATGRRVSKTVLTWAGLRQGRR